jgi:tetratricopeptide (TPR) repeat protein/transcriptional regulator with XRE-family HTH domain
MPVRDLDDLGAALLLLRALWRWTQEDLAIASGVPASAICEYEAGKREPSARNLGRLMVAFRFPLLLLDPLLALIRAVRNVIAVCGALRGGGPPPDLEDLAARAGRVAEEFLRAAFSLALAQLAPAKPPPVPEDRVVGPTLRACLESCSPADRLGLVRAGDRFRTWPLVEIFCADSEQAAADDARTAVEFAELALEIARFVPGDERWRSRVQGYAWAFLGNARRVNGDLAVAKEALARSHEVWPERVVADDGLLDDSRRLDLEASLMRSLRRLPQALSLLDQALSGGPRGSTGRILIKKAKTLEEMGEFESALATLREAIPLVDGTDERLLFALRFNLAVNLCHLGRHAEAELMLQPVRELVARLHKGLGRLRFRWLEGRIAAGLGRTEEAIATLREVCDEFLEREIAFDAALATLELAVLLAEEGRTEEVKALAEQTAPIFAAQGVERERLGALTLFQKAAEEQRLTAALAGQLLVDLRRTERAQ